MTWLRYRRKSSAHLGEWTYVFYRHEVDMNDMRELASDINQEYSWSEHHRGVDVESVTDENVPVDVINKRIAQADQTLNHETAIRKQMFEQLQKIQLSNFSN